MSSHTSIGIASPQDGTGISAVRHTQPCSTQRRKNARSTTASHIEFTAVEIILHYAKCALHVEVTRPDVLWKDGSTPLAYQMPVFAMSVEHAVEIDITIVEFLDDELVILIDPVRIPWL